LFFNICIGKALPQTEYTQARVKVQLTQNELKLFEQSTLLDNTLQLKKVPVGIITRDQAVKTLQAGGAKLELVILRGAGGGAI